MNPHERVGLDTYSGLTRVASCLLPYSHRFQVNTSALDFVPAAYC